MMPSDQGTGAPVSLMKAMLFRAYARGDLTLQQVVAGVEAIRPLPEPRKWYEPIAELPCRLLAAMFRF